MRLISALVAVAATASASFAQFSIDNGIMMKSVQPACGSIDRPMLMNIEESMRDFHDEISNGRGGGIIIIGDSISFKRDSYNWWLRDKMWEDHGWGGEGYVAAGSGFTACVNEPCASTLGPRQPQYMREFDPAGNGPVNGHVTWSQSSTPRDPFLGSFSPDGFWAQIADPSSSIEFTCFGSRLTFFYLNHPDGGLMSVSHNGTHLYDINTFSKDYEVGTFTIDTSIAFGDRVSTSDTHINLLGNGSLVLLGVNSESMTGGYHYSRLARGGQGPADFLLSATPQSASVLQAIDPDVMLIMLDWSNHYYTPGDPMNDEKFWYRDDMNALLDFYQSALPNTEFILVSHHHFREDIEEEAQILFEIACERGMGFIDLFRLHTSQQELFALGFLVDNVHFSAAGGSWFGDYIFDVINADNDTNPPCEGDHNNDGIVSLDDVLLAVRQRNHIAAVASIENLGCKNNVVNQLMELMP